MSICDNSKNNELVLLLLLLLLLILYMYIYLKTKNNCVKLSDIYVYLGVQWAEVYLGAQCDEVHMRRGTHATRYTCDEGYLGALSYGLLEERRVTCVAGTPELNASVSSHVTLTGNARNAHRQRT
jgi:hypothetical protein